MTHSSASFPFFTSKKCTNQAAQIRAVHAPVLRGGGVRDMMSKVIGVDPCRFGQSSCTWSAFERMIAFLFFFFLFTR
jgi:hypothetical protein